MEKNLVIDGHEYAFEKNRSKEIKVFWFHVNGKEFEFSCSQLKGLSPFLFPLGETYSFAGGRENSLPCLNAPLMPVTLQRMNTFVSTDSPMPGKILKVSGLYLPRTR